MLNAIPRLGSVGIDVEEGRGDGEGPAVAHNGVRGDNDVESRETSRVSNRITNWMRRMA